jgi:hypothetical protein
LPTVRRPRSISRGRDRPARSFRSADLPQPGNALYLGFKPNPNNPKPFPQKMRFLALLPQAATNGEPQRVGLAASDLVPPVDLVWEYRPKADQDVWLRLNVLADESVALTRDGYIDVEGPQAIEPSIDPSLKALVAEKRYWVRVRLDQNMYPRAARRSSSSSCRTPSTP